MAKTPSSAEPISSERQHFAAQLVRLRVAKGLTQVQLSDLCGLTQPHLSALERGLWEPRLETIVTLMRALGVSYDELLPPR
ncbi:MAG: helix-turn-helix domain-containing protein [Janthinobacterium lividum]